MEFAYGPLVAALERRLVSAGVPLPPSPELGGSNHRDAQLKRTLLAAAVARFGIPFIEEQGRAFASEAGHPFICALRAAESPSRLLGLWTRLEVLAHSGNRVTLLEVGDRGAELLRTRGTDGAPTLVEDALIMGILSGLLEAIGAVDVKAVVDEASDTQGGGRRWMIRWTRLERPARTLAVEPWGVSHDFARAAFALALEDTAITLPAVARRLCVTPRSLQRRLSDSGTSFRSLVRTARVALAGQALVHGERASTSLSTVAHACGFADSAHLSREFRTLVGVQPSVFAQALRSP